MNDPTEAPTRHIRLASSTLFHVPDCFGIKKPEMRSDSCLYCIIRKQCTEKQEVIWR